MNAREILAQLQKLGKPNTVKIYARHGVSGPCYGVAYGDLKPLVKRAGRNQAVALELWRSGVHDARVAATMIAEPERMTRSQIEQWLGDCANYILTDAVAGVAAAMPEALEMARSWIDGDGEWVTTAGWQVFAVKGANGRLNARDADGLLEKIERTIHAQPNRTRYTMNNALIGMGGYIESLRPRALAVAKAIGTVQVDHGETGCKTPDAAAYIAKLIGHQARQAVAADAGGAPARRARATGAKTKASKTRAAAVRPGRKR